MAKYFQCDETHPKCINCVTANLDCEYTTPAARDSRAIRTQQAQALSSPAPSRDIGDTPATTFSGISGTGGSSINNNDENSLEKLELLHHFITCTVKTFTPIQEQLEAWQVEVVKLGFRYPFLLGEILALAAMHLCYIRPSKAPYYRNKATEFQSEAISGYMNAIQNVNAETCAPVFACAALLGVHVFADRVHFHQTDEGDDHNGSRMLDHLFGSFKLLRGIGPLVRDWWDTLHQSPIRPIIDAKLLPQRDESRIPLAVKQLAQMVGEATESQNRLHTAPYPQDNSSIPPLPPSNLTDQERQSCVVAVERLQWLFASSNINSPPSPISSPPILAPGERLTSQSSNKGIPASSPVHKTTRRLLLSWQIQLPAEYLDLLDERAPEAMIILAHYSVLLHHQRDEWTVGSAGIRMIHAIRNVLPLEWHPWLWWVNEEAQK